MIRERRLDGKLLEMTQQYNELRKASEQVSSFPSVSTEQSVSLYLRSAFFDTNPCSGTLCPRLAASG